MATPKLNQLNSFKHSKSPLNSTRENFNGQDYINLTTKELTSPHVISKMPGPYKGIVFKNQNDATTVIPQELSIFERFTKGVIHKHRIRIPELHCCLVEPDNYDNCSPSIAHLYPEFVSERLGIEHAPPRTIALCTYQDKANYEEPVYLGLFAKEPCIVQDTVSSINQQNAQLNGSAPNGGSQFPSVAFSANSSDIINNLSQRFGNNPNQVVRDVEATDPAFTPLLQSLIENIQTENLPFILNETFRSQIRQNSLYSQGRLQNSDGSWKVIGSTVTDTLNSNHKGGKAADFRLDTNPNHPYWQRLKYIPINPYDTSVNGMRAWQDFGNIAVRTGLSWGGNWSKPDLPHVEVPRNRK